MLKSAVLEMFASASVAIDGDTSIPTRVKFAVLVVVRDWVQVALLEEKEEEEEEEKLDRRRRE